MLDDVRPDRNGAVCRPLWSVFGRQTTRVVQLELPDIEPNLNLFRLYGALLSLVVPRETEKNENLSLFLRHHPLQLDLAFIKSNLQPLP